MNITFLGATKTVTGSNFLVEGAGKKFLVDCGMFQGSTKDELKNAEQEIANAKVKLEDSQKELNTQKQNFNNKMKEYDNQIKSAKTTLDST